MLSLLAPWALVLAYFVDSIRAEPLGWAGRKLDRLLSPRALPARDDVGVTPMTPYCGSQPRLHSRARAGALSLDTGAFVHGDVDNYLERSAP